MLRHYSRVGFEQLRARLGHQGCRLIDLLHTLAPIYSYSTSKIILVPSSIPAGCVPIRLPKPIGLLSFAAPSRIVKTLPTSFALTLPSNALRFPASQSQVSLFSSLGMRRHIFVEGADRAPYREQADWSEVFIWPALIVREDDMVYMTLIVVSRGKASRKRT